MPIEITVPRLGWSMEQGIFAGWLKNDGDQVAAGEPLFALESDKATMEVESLDRGRLHILADAPIPSAIVTVGQRIGYLLTDDDGVPVTLSQPKIFASPRARDAARRLGIDISHVVLQEGARRIVEADIYRHAEKHLARTSPPASQQNTPATPSPMALNARKAIAARMEESFRTPHFYVHDDADATALAALRKDLTPILEEQNQVHLTYNDLLIKAIALALSRCPEINRSYLDDAVVQRAECNIGLAVQAGDQLLVPVIRTADLLPLSEIARARTGLIERCRRSENRLHDFEEGSVTLSNLGSFGVDRFQAILNPPQSAIVAAGRIAKRPVVVNDAVVARLTLPISISVDHRVVDGVAAARFLREIINLLQSPLRLVLPSANTMNPGEVK